VQAGTPGTRFNSRKLDIPALATSPTDDEIDTAAKEASEEAESLLVLLDISPKRSQVPVVELPPIASFHMPEDSSGCNVVVSEAQQLRDLIHEADGKDNEDLLRLAEATALATADEFMRMYVAYI